MGWRPLRRECRGVLAGILFALAGTAFSAEDFAFLPAPDEPDPAESVLVDLASAGGRVVAVGERGLVALGGDGAWRRAPVPVSTMLTAVDFVDASHGWAVGHGGVILASDDGGESWRLQLDGRAVNRQFHEFAQARVERLTEELDAVPEDAPDREEREYALEDAEFALEDAERALETGPVDPFLDVTFLDRSRGFAVGAYGHLFRTDDGGSSWRIAIEGLDNPGRYHYYALHERNGVLYLSGEAGLLFVSADGGDAWRRIEGVYDGSLFGLVDIGEGVAAYGLRGNIFFTEDGGDSWRRLATRSESSLYGGTALGDGSALLVGAGGTILRIDASGTATIYGHPDRATLSAALPVGDTVYLAGMAGIGRLGEAEQR